MFEDERGAVRPPPASTRTATIPSGVVADMMAAITAMLISDFVLAADRPSRYNATANKPMTTGPRPYSAPRAISVNPSCDIGSWGLPGGAVSENGRLRQGP